MTDRFVILALFALPMAAQQAPFGALDVKMFGATGNTQEVTDAAMGYGTSVVTTALGRFTPQDVGKPCVIATYVGQTLAWQGSPACTITGYTSPTTITVSLAASVSYTQAVFDWGTDDTSAIGKCVSALPHAGGTCYFPPDGTCIHRPPRLPAAM